MDLSKMKVSQPAIAIDTQNSYKEINLEKLEPMEQIWQAPYLSTWAVAVGKFCELREISINDRIKVNLAKVGTS
jgi:hypothetical protein